jgi:hypothetical protein
MDISTLVTFFSGISFLFYGTACLTSPRMKSEFIRFGYGGQRVLTGYLQLLGGLGLLIGYGVGSPFLGFFSATGLCLMMIFGFGVRLKIRDSLLASSPALLYAVLNGYLGIHYWNSFYAVV